MKVFRRIAAACAVAVGFASTASAATLADATSVEVWLGTTQGGSNCLDGPTDTFSSLASGGSSYTIDGPQGVCVLTGESVVLTETGITVNSTAVFVIYVTVRVTGIEFTADGGSDDGAGVGGGNVIRLGDSTATSLSLRFTIGNAPESWTFGFVDNTGGPNGEVPLPMSAALLLTGMGGLALSRRRRR